MPSGNINIKFGQKPYMLQASATHSQHQIMGIGSGPQTPKGLTATVISQNEIDLSWNASSGVGLLGYRLYRGGAQIAQQVGLTFADTGLSPATLYSYQVSAYGANFETPKSSAVSASTFGSGVGAFDFYISPGGSSGNPGTLAGPWDIGSLNTKRATYGGKKVGLLPGTYGVSSFMIASGSNYNNVAISIQGGTTANPTYVASCDASGNYLPPNPAAADGAKCGAIIKGDDNGIKGGGLGNKCSMIGQGGSGVTTGNLTLDAIGFTGASLWCVTFGDTAGTNLSPPNLTIQNCEAFNNGVTGLTVANGENCAVYQLMSGTNFKMLNNYLHDNIGGFDNQHFSALYHWGLQTATHGSVIKNNTIINSGQLHGKESNQYDIEIGYNYIDCSNKNPSGGYTAPIFGFCRSTPGLGTLSKFHHNILIAPSAAGNPAGSGAVFIGLRDDLSDSTYNYPCQIYNNTMIPAFAANGAGIMVFPTATGLVKLYNNGFYDNGLNTYTQYGQLYVANGFSVIDYNSYATQWKLSTLPLGSSPDTGLASVASLAAWKTATGQESHSFQSNANPFTAGSGTAASKYLTPSGIWFNTGKVGGIAAGTTCNIGAQDGTGSIGCSFGPQ